MDSIMSLTFLSCLLPSQAHISSHETHLLPHSGHRYFSLSGWLWHLCRHDLPSIHMPSVRNPRTNENRDLCSCPGSLWDDGAGGRSRVAHDSIAGVKDVPESVWAEESIVWPPSSRPGGHGNDSIPEDRR